MGSGFDRGLVYVRQLDDDTLGGVTICVMLRLHLKIKRIVM